MEPTMLTGLAPLQAQVALALAAGESISSAAQSTGVGRTTIYSWIHNEPSFAPAVQQAQADFVLTLRDQLRDASLKALATLTALMDDPKASASVRLKAALAVLNRPQAPDQRWNFPDTADTLDTAQEPPMNKTEHNSETPLPSVESTLRNITKQYPNIFSRPQPARSHKVRRNQPCPCDSGRKFKHCCIDKPAQNGGTSV